MPESRIGFSQTSVGRALAGRALALVTAHEADALPHPAGLLDLTTPETAIAPEHVRAAAASALDRGETHYTVRPGVPELRAAIARRSTEDGFPATVEGTVVTNGGAEALYIALQSTLKPAGRALLGGPVAPNVVEMIAFIGATSEWLPLDDARFAPSPSDVRAARGDVLLLASPSPVTGIAIPPDDLRALVAAADEAGTTVILDRSLAWCCYQPGAARFPDPDLGSRMLTTGSFSAAYGLAGWRVGYFSAPAAYLAEMRELKQAMSICTSAVSQFAALAALDGPPEWLRARRDTFAARRDAVLAALPAGGPPPVAPDAWPPLLLDMRWAGPDDDAFAARLRAEHRLIVEPASRYSPLLRGHLRIDLGAPQAAIDALIAALRETHRNT